MVKRGVENKNTGLLFPVVICLSFGAASTEQLIRSIGTVQPLVTGPDVADTAPAHSGRFTVLDSPASCYSS